MEDLNTFRMEIPDSDTIERLPEKSFDLEKVKNCALFDINRKPVLFSELISNTSTTIFVFIRHFLDYVTREYVEDFSKIFPHILQEKNVRILLIGCAPAKYIRQFVEDTNCPHQVYCDSRRLIHNLMGFHTVALEAPSFNSPHIKTNAFVGFWQTVWRAMTSQTEQGSPFQMGGQMIVDPDGKIIFFHRDKHPLDHTPINELLAVTGLPRIDFCTKFKIKHV